MLKQLRPQRLRDADELVPQLRKLRHCRRLVLVDAQVVRERISVMVGHLVAIEVDLEAEAVRLWCSRRRTLPRSSSPCSSDFLAFSLLRPVLALRVLVRAARLVRGGEREQSESWYPSRHRACLFSLRRRARAIFCCFLVAAKSCAHLQSVSSCKQSKKRCPAPSANRTDHSLAREPDRPGTANEGKHSTLFPGVC